MINRFDFLYYHLYEDGNGNQLFFYSRAENCMQKATSITAAWQLQRFFLTFHLNLCVSASGELLQEC